MKRKIPGIILSFIAVTFVATIYNACMPLGFEAQDLSSEELMGQDSALAASGKVLYASHCASCHMPIENSGKRDRNAVAISAAINSVPQMAGLKGTLSNSDLDAIAAALSTSFCTPAQLSKSIMRRMNYREFSNSTRDLFGSHSLAAADYADDSRAETGFDNDGSALVTDDIGTNKIISAAEKIADQILANANSKFNSCNTASNKASCMQNLLMPVVRRAFRINVTAADMQPIVTIATAPANAKDGIRDAMVAIMASPRFLFTVVNYAQNRAGTMHTVSLHELASKMALFIWASVPDDELLNLADNGELGKLDVQKQQVARMLSDARSKGLIEGFGPQWLGYHTLPHTERSASAHPGFTPAVKSAMMKEAELHFQDIISRKLGTDALVTASYTFVDKTLADYYGLPYPSTGSGFVPVMLDGKNRRGILTQGAVMTTTSHTDATNPIHRGKVFLDKVICSPTGPPPEGIPKLPALQPGMTMKELLRAHRTDSTCASCHVYIDPMGLAWENLNAAGKWRDTDRGIAIDASNETADGFKFSKPGEFAGWIASGDKFENCVSQYLSVYAIGRAPKAGEACYSKKIVKDKLQPQGATFVDLIEGIVTSDLFKKSIVKE